MRYLYKEKLKAFYNEDNSLILGKLCENYHGNLPTTTKESWQEEIETMKQVVSQYIEDDGQLILEYNIPRLSKRVDTILLLKGIIFCIEFKTGKEKEEDCAEQHPPYPLQR